jgi:hypothetical protein
VRDLVVLMFAARALDGTHGACTDPIVAAGSVPRSPAAGRSMPRPCPPSGAAREAALRAHEDRRHTPPAPPASGRRPRSDSLPLAVASPEPNMGLPVGESRALESQIRSARVHRQERRDLGVNDWRPATTAPSRSDNGAASACRVEGLAGYADRRLGRRQPPQRAVPSSSSGTCAASFRVIESICRAASASTTRSRC